MLITKEQQEAWVSAYVREKHTQDECIGFIDGINKTLEVLKEKLSDKRIEENKEVWDGTTVDFANSIIRMRELYHKGKYGLAESERDKLIDKLDDIMRIRTDKKY